MNLLARILSHGFAFAVVALIIIVLMYRGDLFEEWELPDYLVFNEKSDATGDSGSGAVERGSQAVAESSKDTATPGESASAIVESAPEQTTTGDIVSTPTAPDMPPPTVSAGAADETIHVTPADTGAAQVDDAGAAEASAPTSHPDSTPATETVMAGQQQAELSPSTATSPAVSTDTGPAEAVADTGSASAGSAPAAETATDGETTTASGTGTEPDAEASTDTEGGEPDTPYSVLAKAREAYWLRDFNAAEQLYNNLIQLEPGNPDGYGEMGNMYFSRGMWDEAADAYYEAGVRLLDEGLVVQARQMVEVIRGLKGSQADKLDRQIEDSLATSP